jgi:S-adenosylmethionine-diacylglycerol 3-amino-3-carboxypropyl transferase
MSDAIGGRADFSRVRYAQVWEDADVLLDGLAVKPGDRCLAIASAGDNALALLTARPAEVVALDLSDAQLACLALRVAALKTLDHPELLELIGSAASERRAALYARCRPALDAEARAFWDARPEAIAEGIGRAGKFERYFALFRRVILPLTQRRSTVEALATGGPALGADERARRAWYDRHWDNRRWRFFFRVFTSRFVLGRLGRDPRFFDHVEGSVADRLLARVRQAVTATDPAGNAYLQWILTGEHRTALPLWLRPEHFDTIRDHVDRLTWRRASLEDVLAGADARSFDRFALSDVFEYVPVAHYERLLEEIARVGRPGGRLAYWNLLAPRRRPERLAGKIAPLPELSRALHACDKAPFYGAFVVEEVRG